MHLDPVRFSLPSVVWNLKKGSPFSTYGETALILAQNFVLVALCTALGTYPRRQKVQGVSGLAAFMFVVVAVVRSVTVRGSGFSPLDGLYAFMTVLSLGSRVPQIVQNMRQHHTGVLAFPTVFMNVGGNIVRVVTTVHAGLDTVVLVHFSICLLLNSTLLVQLALYWKRTNDVLAQAAGKKQT